MNFFRISDKIKLRRVRKSIISGSKLFENGRPKNLDEDTLKSINCYAYSLGIMYNAESWIRHSPGYTQRIRYQGISPEELMRNVKTDLKNLKIMFRCIGLGEEIELNSNEYLVKVFYTPPNSRLLCGDFHFIRKDPKTGKWFHKMGWYNQPCLVRLDNDYKKKHLGEEPDRITNREEDGFFFVYRAVYYLAITEV